MNVSFDPAVSLCWRWLTLALADALVFCLVRLVLNFLLEDGASLKGLPPLRIEVLAGVTRSWRLVFGDGRVALQVLKLSSRGIRSTFSGVFGEDTSAMLALKEDKILL